MREIKLEWLDSVSNNTWTTQEELKERHSEHCQSVGWLISETEDDYKITTTLAPDGDVLGYVIIPKVSVVKMELTELLINGLEEL